MTLDEKVAVARQLCRLGVDVIEAGFPVASQDDFAAVRTIAGEARGPIIAALCRADRNDITCAWEAVRGAQRPRIHTFIATSDVHLEHKLRMTRPEVLGRITDSVSFARSLCQDVEFSAEDASRSDESFLKAAIRAAVAAGATTINIPDTVGYSQPQEFGELVSEIVSMPEITAGGVTVSVHCHDDLGLAVANSLEAIRRGAGQVECTVNGIGERAGNAALEEVVMNLRTRGESFGVQTGIKANELYQSSRLVSRVTGIAVQRNKAVVGANAFSHEAGIHQHGMLANRATYEIMLPAEVGWIGEGMVIGKHSGRHAIGSCIKEAGITFTDEQLAQVVSKVKSLADRQKSVSAEEVVAIAEGMLHEGVEPALRVVEYAAFTGNGAPATASLAVVVDGRTVKASNHGIGIVDASFSALKAATGIDARLAEYSLKAVAGGSNALAEVTVAVESGGRIARSRGVHEDVAVASLNAFVAAFNRLLALRGIT